MGNDLLRQLLSSIHGATWYAILADETADIANHEHEHEHEHEQLSVSIRGGGGGGSGGTRPHKQLGGRASPPQKFSQ